MTSGTLRPSRRAIAAVAVLALSACGDGFRGLDAAILANDAAAVDASIADAHVVTVDAAPDASLTDAAIADAAPADASRSDAHVADASPPDAAPPDARLPDASPPDARLPDASPPDARLPDASPPDAAPATIITVFATPSQFTGNLGGRSGADSACRANVGQLSCPSAVHALISATFADSLAAMPDGFGVPTDEPLNSSSGVTIATNWADLLDGSLDHSFGVAGLFDVNSSTDWWSGSNADGTPSNNRCADWASDASDPTFKGEIGVSSAFNSTWVTAGASACNNTFALICLCY